MYCNTYQISEWCGVALLCNLLIIIQARLLLVHNLNPTMRSISLITQGGGKVEADV